MPAYQLHIYEQQEEREALEQKICEQVDYYAKHSALYDVEKLL